ncbi:hypothetical protein AB0J57_34175 [Streptomyces sp. NPDC049837]|uniref:hypothetical protein n=1 Tax=Streptomyces sp. NPDC049837 TaxID=3155277 RepID=UPI00342DD084
MALVAHLRTRAPAHRGAATLLATAAPAPRWPVTKVLRELAGRGVLRLGRGRITVLDPGWLRDEAG